MIITSAKMSSDQKLKDVRKKIKTSDTCPDEIILLDYINGTLRREERDALNQHLSDCCRCLDIITLYDKLSLNNESEVIADSPQLWQEAVKKKITIELKKT